MKKPLEALVAKKLRCSRSDISRLIIVRRSIDARRKPRIYFVFTVDVEFVDESRVWKRCRDNKDVRQLAESSARISGPVRSRLPTGPSSSGPARPAWRQPWPWLNTAMRLSSLNGGVTSIPARKTLRFLARRPLQGIVERPVRRRRSGDLFRWEIDDPRQSSAAAAHFADFRRCRSAGRHPVCL